MQKRHSQESASNGAICIGPNGGTITRCVDDPDHHKCEIYQRKQAPWCHGTIPMECPLPRAVEE